MALARWTDMEAGAPELAAAGRALLYNYGPGLGFLGTVRSDGGPRVHPVCPALANDGLYVFVGNQSPKVQDLRRDPRYALHSFPLPDVDDEFYVSGVTRVVDDADVRAIVYDVYTSTGAFTSDDTLFELFIERAMHAKYRPRPSWPPTYTKWSPAA